MTEKTKLLLEKIETEIRDASTHFELVLDLFGTHENLAIVNQSSPFVFTIVRQSLLDSAIIRLNRLCDPAGMKGNQNISLATLRESLDQSDQSFIDELNSLEEKIRSEVSKLRKYRHKRLAHNDLKTHKNKLHRTIKNSAIDDSLKSLEEYINKIYLKLENYTVAILDSPYPLGDGPHKLMKLIKNGIKCQPGSSYNSD